MDARCSTWQHLATTASGDRAPTPSGAPSAHCSISFGVTPSNTIRWSSMLMQFYICVCIYIYTHTHLTPYFAVLFQSIYAASNVCFYLCLQLNLQETCGKHNLPIGNITPQATDKPLDKTPKWHQHQFFKERLRWTSHSNNVNYTWWIKWEEKTPREFSEGC